MGFVVESIEKSAPAFAAGVDCKWDGLIIEEPNQRARVSFCRPSSPGEAQFELVDPGAFEDSPVRRFLDEEGGGLHHVCYEVPDLKSALAQMRKAGGVIVRKPLPGVAFDGRLIAWVYTVQKLLVELLEVDNQPNLLNK